MDIFKWQTLVFEDADLKNSLLLFTTLVIADTKNILPVLMPCISVELYMNPD